MRLCVRFPLCAYVFKLALRKRQWHSASKPRPKGGGAVPFVLTLRMGPQEALDCDTKCDTFAIRRAQIDGIAWLQRRRKGAWRGMQESNLRPPVS